MSKITPTFLLLSIALLLWSLSAGLSKYLAEGFSRNHARGQTQAAAPSSEEVAALRKAANASPNDADVQLNLAFGILRDAYAKGDGSVLMDAVKAFQKVLELKPEQPDALLGLATLCMEAGIIDKALEYYPRYIKQRPEDLRAQSDYALALARGGDASKAEELVKAVLQKDANFFPGLVSAAVVARIQGNVEQAEQFAKQAIDKAPDEDAKKRVESFIAGVAEAGQGDAAPAEAVSPETMSPARQITEVIKGHPIVGPKVQRISWPEEHTARVELANFPVSQMPPFAKTKFITGVQEKLQRLPEKFTIELVDQQNEQERLTVEVGSGVGAAANAQ